MGKIVISPTIISDKISELKKGLSSNDVNNISINAKVEILNWILNDISDKSMETISFKELRLRYLSNSRDTMTRWLERAYPNGLIIEKNDKP